MVEAVLFYTFAVLVLLAGLSVVVRRNPLSAAISLVACFFFLAGLYVMLDAHFLAVVQVLVYAGAIMVLFIFVIMLLNLGERGRAPIGDLAPRALAGLAAAGLLGTGMVAGLDMVRGEPMGSSVPGFGSIEQVGQAIFGGGYLLPFEVASVLLTVAMVGAVVLAKREI